MRSCVLGYVCIQTCVHVYDDMRMGSCVCVRTCV